MNLTVINRLATIIIVLVVVIIGGVVTITNSADLSFAEYLKAVGVAVGLLGVGYGLDSHSRP